MQMKIKRIKDIILQETKDKYTVRFSNSKSKKSNSFYCELTKDNVSVSLRFSDHFNGQRYKYLHVSPLSHLRDKDIRRYVRDRIHALEVKYVSVLLERVV